MQTSLGKTVITILSGFVICTPSEKWLLRFKSCRQMFTLMAREQWQEFQFNGKSWIKIEHRKPQHRNRPFSPYWPTNRAAYLLGHGLYPTSHVHVPLNVRGIRFKMPLKHKYICFYPGSLFQAPITLCKILTIFLSDRVYTLSLIFTYQPSYTHTNVVNLCNLPYILSTFVTPSPSDNIYF